MYLIIKSHTIIITYYTIFCKYWQIFLESKYLLTLLLVLVIIDLRRHGQVVRQEPAKLLSPSSNLGVAFFDALFFNKKQNSQPPCPAQRKSTRCSLSNRPLKTFANVPYRESFSDIKNRTSKNLCDFPTLKKSKLFTVNNSFKFLTS